MSSIGTYGKSCNNLKPSLRDLNQEEAEAIHNILKSTQTCIRTSHYIFCMRHKERNNPELMAWWMCKLTRLLHLQNFLMGMPIL